MNFINFRVYRNECTVAKILIQFCLLANNFGTGNRIRLSSEVGVTQNSSQVSQVAQFALRTMPFFQLLRNLRCAVCLLFQRLRNLRLRIGKSNICCAFTANFFQNAQSQNNL